MKIYASRYLTSSLVPFVRRYLWTVPIVAVLGFVGSASEGLGISLLVPFLAILFSGDTNHALPGPLALLTRFLEAVDPSWRLEVVAGAIFSAIALKCVIRIVNDGFIAWIYGRASHDIRCAMERELLTASYPFFLSTQPGRLLNIFSTESWRAADALHMLFRMIANAAAVCVYALLLLSINWRLTLIVAGGVIVVRLIQSRLIRIVRHRSERSSEANWSLTNQMITSINSVRVIRVFGQEGREAKRFERESDTLRRVMFALERVTVLVAPSVELLHAALFLSVLVGAYAAGVDVPVLMAFLVLLYRCQPFLQELNHGPVEIAAAGGSVREVEWLLDPSHKPSEPKGSVQIATLDRPIVFDDVGYVYATRPDAVPALSHVSVTIHPGRSIALIGRSGSGKSTIVNLLCKLLSPTSGAIRIGGTDLTQICTASWRRHIGLAGQDIDLIDGTIVENITYGLPDAPMADIIEAARIADAHDFIEALPQGYETIVGDKGQALSGGQRQRVGLARALLRKPHLLILDEATNAVDGLSEAAIFGLLSHRARQMTTIVISHRASTLARCDDGIVIENGHVVDFGSLETLEAYRTISAATA